MLMVKPITLHKLIVFITLFLSFSTVAFAQLQDENKMEEKSSGSATFSAGADLVSRYVWRGADYGNSPGIQPAVAFSVAGFKAGFWGSYGMGQYSRKINDSTVANMGHYAEFDMYVSYTMKGFTLMAYDYFFPNSLSPNTGNKYFNFKKNSTGHTVEVCLSWAGPEKFPLQLYAGTFVYGGRQRKRFLRGLRGGKR